MAGMDASEVAANDDSMAAASADDILPAHTHTPWNEETIELQADLARTPENDHFVHHTVWGAIEPFEDDGLDSEEISASYVSDVIFSEMSDQEESALIT
jgi:hypothetical protein